MPNVFQISIDGLSIGMALKYGHAVERAYYFSCDEGYISEANVAPDILIGSAYEGNQLDLMARELETDSTIDSVVFTKHDLYVEPTTSSDMGLAPIGRSEVPTFALQQAIYDVASGSDPDIARQNLKDLMEQLVSNVGTSFAEQQIFYFDCREAGTYLGATYRDRLLPIPTFNQKESLAQLIGQIPYGVLAEFDNAVELIAQLRAESTPSP
jgi:hypothetical protein